MLHDDNPCMKKKVTKNNNSRGSSSSGSGGIWSTNSSEPVNNYGINIGVRPFLFINTGGGGRRSATIGVGVGIFTFPPLGNVNRNKSASPDTIRCPDGTIVTVLLTDEECPNKRVNGVCVGDDKIINKLTNPCAKNTFTELENGIYQGDPIKPEVEILSTNLDKLNFSQEILHLFANSKNTHLTIQNGTTSGSNASTVGADITVSNSYLSNATKLSIARTMIHESIHVYISALYSNVVHFSSFSFREKIEKYAKDNGYTIGTNRFHHEFMGQYVNAIAISLYEWDKEYGSGKGNNFVTKPDDLLGWDYYRSMAFAGLSYKKKDAQGNVIKDSNGNPIILDTDSFKKLVPLERDRNQIKKIINNETRGNSNSKGSKCN